MSSTIEEILQSGIIVAADEETGALVQANGSYFNFYAKIGEGKYDNTDCVANSEWGDMRSKSAADYMDRGQELLDRWLNEDCPECGEPREKADIEWHCKACENPQ